MNAHTNITPSHSDDDLPSLLAELEAGQHYANMLKMGLPPANEHRLWAAWHYYKALHLRFASDDTEEWFEAACRNLNVDSAGERRAA